MAAFIAAPPPLEASSDFGVAEAVAVKCTRDLIRLHAASSCESIAVAVAASFDNCGKEWGDAMLLLMPKSPSMTEEEAKAYIAKFYTGYMTMRRALWRKLEVEAKEIRARSVGEAGDALGYVCMRGSLVRKR